MVSYACPVGGESDVSAYDITATLGKSGSVLFLVWWSRTLSCGCPHGMSQLGEAQLPEDGVGVKLGS